jgi:hypothetical protein
MFISPPTPSPQLSGRPEAPIDRAYPTLLVDRESGRAIGKFGPSVPSMLNGICTPSTDHTTAREQLRSNSDDSPDESSIPPAGFPTYR